MAVSPNLSMEDTVILVHGSMTVRSEKAVWCFSSADQRHLAEKRPLPSRSMRAGENGYELTHFPCEIMYGEQRNGKSFPLPYGNQER